MTVRNRNRVFVALGLAAVAAAGVILLSVRQYSAREAVGELLVSRGTNRVRALSEVVQQGDAGYAEVARVLRAEETLFDEQYDQWRSKLPASIRDQVPPRASKKELRRNIARMANFLGPAGARALVPAVEHAVKDSDPITSLELVRTLEWSIPESPRAIRILSNYMASPSPGKHMLGMVSAPDIWRTVPELAPVVAPWLKLSDQAGEAAEALGAMGEAGAFAVEDLAEVAVHGVAGDPPRFQPHVTYNRGFDPRVNNRREAIRALGMIGVTNGNVFAAFEKAIVGEDQLLRCFAADGLGFLGAKALPLLPYLLEHLDRSNRLVLSYQIEAIGKMGPGARAAVPALVHYSDPDVALKVPSRQPPNRMIRRDSEAMPIPHGAAFALAKIAPEEARSRVEAVIRALGMRIPEEEIVQLRPLKDQLLPVGADLLGGRDMHPIIAGNLALNLLRLEPGFRPALKVLEAQLSGESAWTRAGAAIKYFHATGNTNKVLAVLENALESSDERQRVVQTLGELGPAGKPLIPQLLDYLEDENFGLRMAAGRSLRLIDPGALPPVKEEGE